MKKIYIAILISFFTSTLLVKTSYADVCSIPEGTYVGLALVEENGKKEKWPFFVVVANKYISGFFAPEDQREPKGTIINQTELTSEGNNSLTFFIKSSKNGDFLNFKPSATTDEKALPFGKAKQIKVNGAELFTSGYFLPEEGNNGDFLNIGKDGGAVARITVNGDSRLFFGDVDSGSFDQAFPESGSPELILTIYFREDRLQASFQDGLGNSVTGGFYTRISNEPCPTVSDSSQGGAELLVKNFQDELAKIKSAAKDLLKATKKTREGTTFDPFIKNITKDTISSAKKITSAIKGAPSIICQTIVTDHVDRIDEALNDLLSNTCRGEEIERLKGESCIPSSQVDPFNEQVTSYINLVRELLALDKNDSKISDICEQ